MQQKASYLSISDDRGKNASYFVKYAFKCRQSKLPLSLIAITQLGQATIDIVKPFI